MRKLLLLSACCWTVSLAAAGANSPAISLREDGTLAIQSSAEVPRYAAAGQWIEMTGEASARFVNRHFVFTVPNGPPAMELYVTHALTGGAPDGVFEIGLVGGFLSGFSSKAGFRYDNPVFDETVVGSARVKRCRVELAKGDKRIWLYAYIFVREPSLTFLTVRAQADAGRSIEEYLHRVRLE